MLSNSCPSSTISGYQFKSHYDCVNAGYSLAQNTFRNLEEIEEYCLKNGQHMLGKDIIKLLNYMEEFQRWILMQ